MAIRCVCIHKMANFPSALEILVARTPIPRYFITRGFPVRWPLRAAALGLDQLSTSASDLGWHNQWGLLSLDRGLTTTSCSPPSVREERGEKDGLQRPPCHWWGRGEQAEAFLHRLHSLHYTDTEFPTQTVLRSWVGDLPALRQPGGSEDKGRSCWYSLWRWDCHSQPVLCLPEIS